MSSIVPKTPGSTYEEINAEDCAYFFAFEPDPDYAGTSVSIDHADRADCYNAGIKRNGHEEGSIFFTSLQEMENFANQLLDYVRRHKS